MPDEWVSIGQAAQLLGVTERHARRLAAQIGEGDRRSDTLPTGRKRLAVRLQAIRQAHSGQDADAPPEMSGPMSAPADTPPMQLAAERVIQEQAAQIASLLETQAKLLTALQLAQENLAREQTLRALPQPAEAGSAAKPDESEARPKRWRWPWETEKGTEDK